MFNKLKGHWTADASFSIRLAEELVRAELQKLYGPQIKIFRLDTDGTPIKRKLETSVEDVSSTERRFFSDATKERYVTFFGIIGPFERSFPDAPESDQRRNLRKFRATCRLYSIESGCIWWNPHFVRLEVRDSYDKLCDSIECRYVHGRVSGEPKDANAENPCEDMCTSQVTANYPQFHGLTKNPEDQVPRGD